MAHGNLSKLSFEFCNFGKTSIFTIVYWTDVQYLQLPVSFHQPTSKRCSVKDFHIYAECLHTVGKQRYSSRKMQKHWTWLSSGAFGGLFFVAESRFLVSLVSSSLQWN